MKLWEYFVHKENKNNDVIQQIVSSVSPWPHFGEYHIRKQRMYADMLFTFRSKRKQREQHKQRIRVLMLHTLFTYVILSKMAPTYLAESFISAILLYSI